MLTGVLQHVSLGLAAVAAGWSLVNILRAAEASDPPTRRRVSFQKAVLALSLMVLVPSLLEMVGIGIPSGAVQGLLLVALLYYIFASRKQ